jgi:solute carrier family 34 (sodium-dependent phosphate cotransporter)
MEEIHDATWAEVFEACCVHTAAEWVMIFFGICLVLFFLYFFLFGLELMGTGAKVAGGCSAGALFGDEVNPVAGLMIGVLATVLLQSSSTTTSIIVLLVGAGSVSVRQGIFMIMGANIGTTITNTLVALGHLGNGDQLERAFAGATVHDMFNYLTVATLFPLELIFGFLRRLTGAMVANVKTKDGESWEGPIKKIVAPLGDMVILANKKVTAGIAETNKTCEDFYPVVCSDMDNPTYKTCEDVGLISCNKKTGDCPVFFDPNADPHDDKVSGFVCMILGLAILFICLLGLVFILQKLLLASSARIINKATDMNGYLAIAVGAGITILVQSSSITTSAMTPLVGMGILRLEQMFPLTLGANIGTTITALLASLVSEGTDALQVALCHLFFNVFGIIIWYPIPFMRAVPLGLARGLGRGTRMWGGFPIAYIFVAFFLVPLIFLGLSSFFSQGSKGLTVLGSIVVFFVAVFCLWLGYYCQYKGGKEKCVQSLESRERRRVTQESLPEDMEFLKSKIKLLLEHNGLANDEEEIDVEEKAPGKDSEIDSAQEVEA